MRRDMDKVICERERRGCRSYESVKGRDKDERNRDAEDKFDQLDSMPRHESMKRRLRGETRTFNEHLEPLRRCLEKAVGRPWDKIKSEMHKIVGLNSVVHRHVWQHVKDFVSENIVAVDGKLYERQESLMYRRGSNVLPGTNLVRLDKKNRQVYLYVDPRTGILRKHRDWKSGFKIDWPAKQQEERAAHARDTDDDSVQYHKINGTWYAITIEAYDIKSEFVSDILVRKPVTIYEPSRYRPQRQIEPSHEMVAHYGRPGLRGARKRALNKKELRKAGLTNDPPTV